MTDEPPSKASASVLGRAMGLTGVELNILLKDAGFLEGEPGLYNVTEKGALYADERDFHSGPGGYPMFNRDWTTTSWDRSVLDELGITPERKEFARETAAERRREKAAERAADAESMESSTDNDEYVLDVDKLLTVAGIVILVSAAGYGIWKLAPHIKRTYDEKATPRLRQLRTRIARDGELEPRRGDSDDRPSA